MRTFLPAPAISIIHHLQGVSACTLRKGEKKAWTSSSRWVFSPENVINQVETWNRELPWIAPYYAMKANPRTELLNAMFYPVSQMGIDVASISEMKTALRYVPENKIIYTNPHLIPHEKDAVKQMGIRTKVVDSLGEMRKMKEYGFFPMVLIRLNSGSNHADCAFDSKFGCSQEEGFAIMEYAKENGYVIRGVSFHIGSGGNFDRKAAYQRAVEYAIPLLHQIMNPVLDIGGGLLHDTDLKEVLGWTQDLPYRIIAEPGRYFAESAYHLAIQVIAKTERGIYLDNGIYHELNVYHRDHWQFPLITHLYDNIIETMEEVHDYIIADVFGPTCDSYDVIPQVRFPVMIQEGDWIFLNNMGAYTSSAGIPFNGVSLASEYTTRLR